MGEAKRRKAIELGIELGIARDVIPGNGADALVGSVLKNIADILGCMIFLKEAGEDLLDWPIGSIVGKTTDTMKVRQCPVTIEIRERLLPRLRWEFLITDKILTITYEVDAEKHGIAYPGPIDPPESFPEHVRKWFVAPDQRPPAGGWKGVIPSNMVAIVRSHPHGAKPNCMRHDGAL
jgi:hypothetical protein